MANKVATGSVQTNVFRLVGGYIIMATAWLVCSDFLLRQLISDKARAARLDVVGDCLFVVGSAFLLAWLEARYFRRIAQSAAELRASEEMLRLMGDNLPGSYIYKYTVDPSGTGRFLHVSAGVEQVHGLAAEQLLKDASGLFQQIEPAQLPVYRAAEAESARNQTDFEMDLRFRLPTGQARLSRVRSRPHRESTGRIVWDGFVTDITEQNRAEAALRERENQLRLFIEHSPAAIAMLDVNMRYLVVSRRWLSDYRVQEQDITGRSHYEVFPEITDTWRKIHQRCLAGAVEACEAEAFTRADGSVDWVRWEIRPWRLNDGAVGGLIIFSELITERKTHELEIERLSRLYATLSQVNQAIMRSQTGRELCSEICRVMIEFGNFRAVQIAEQAGDPGTFTTVAERTRSGASEAPEPGIGCGIVAEALRSGSPKLCNDLRTDPGAASCRERLLRAGVGSCAAFPLLQQGKGWGVIGIYAGEAGFFKAEENRLLEEVAADISHALEQIWQQEQRQQFQAALRESENKYRSLFEASRDAIMTVDPASGRFSSGNPAALKMFGVGTEAELVSHTPADFSPERQPDGRRSAERTREIDAAVLREGSMFIEWKHRRLQGQEFFADVLLTRIERDGKPAVMATVRDITQRKEVEQERMRLVTALEQAAETVVITDVAGTIVYANPAFEQTSGYSRSEAIGRNPRMLKSGQQDAAFYRDLWHTLIRGEVWHGRLINKRKDGRIFQEKATISPIRNPEGKIVNYIAVKLDVTRELELEARFLQAQKMEAIGQLAGGVAHDFNNILAAIMMQAEMTALSEDLPEKFREGLEEIRASTERAANLTRQLLLFSRRQVMQRRDLDLNDIVTSLAKMLQRIIGEDVRLQLSLHPHPLNTHADAGMLDQVLMNLAVNARDAMPSGGRLLIETGEKDGDEAFAQLHPGANPGRHVWLSVSDTGYGIPAEILPRIFEPFFTTKEPGKGTGLGLATVFGIAQQHGGWVSVESQSGQGARFQIFLPAAEPVSAGAATAEARPKPRGGTEIILLAEDDRAVRVLTRATLERFGYRVLEAASGTEASLLWQEHSGAITLLLTDLVMPGGTSGQQLARQLQATRPSLKVIYTSGYSAEIAGREMELRPGENFVQKPASPYLLLETVRRCLDS